MLECEDEAWFNGGGTELLCDDDREGEGTVSLAVRLSQKSHVCTYTVHLFNNKSTYSNHAETVHSCNRSPSRLPLVSHPHSYPMHPSLSDTPKLAVR